MKFDELFDRYLHAVNDWVQAHKFARYLPQFLMGLVIAGTVTFLFPSGESFEFATLKQGDVYTGKEIIAPFTFPINKSEEEIERDREAAAEKIPPVFVRYDSIEQAALQRFGRLYQKVDSIRTAKAPDSLKLRQVADILNEHSILIEDSLLPFFLRKKWSSPEDQAQLTPEFSEVWEKYETVLIDIYAKGILNLPTERIPDHVDEIAVLSEQGENIQELETFLNQSDYKNEVLEKLRQAFPQQNSLVKIGYSILTTLLRPNLIYDEEETNSRKAEAVANVPLAKGLVLEDERIINSHEVVTKDILEKLRSLAAARAERNASRGGVRQIYPVLGRFMLLGIALSFMGLFLVHSRGEIFNNLRKMLMIFVIFVIILGIAITINKIGFSTNLKYLIPIPIASMLLTIFFDTRTAFVGTVTLSIIVGALWGNEFGITIINLFVGSVSTFSVREIQARNWILKGILTISGMYFISIAAVALLKGTDPSELWGMCLFGLLNGVFSPIMTYALMVFFEWSFKFTTNSTLLELSDLNKPLLRQLAMRAPGTYHHSIMVGNLSEAAAENIGANALLTRVASYYHDIGKMEKPEYFVENQKGGKNPHEKLAPTMSCLILINHVKKGLELAEEYNLPREIRDIIPQHHGTNLIQFFYAKALENSDGQEVNESDFRYPGPKPQTKEAGIVMLADAVEAGSRTLKEPSVSRIRNMIDDFVDERMEGDELDECPLTMRDITRIKESFVNNLTGMFHGRIEYPDSKKLTPKSSSKAAQKK